jgi:hypothetical protein
MLVASSSHKSRGKRKKERGKRKEEIGKVRALGSLSGF